MVVVARVFHLLGVWSRCGFEERKTLRFGPSQVLEVGVLGPRKGVALGQGSLNREDDLICGQEEKNAVGSEEGLGEQRA